MQAGRMPPASRVEQQQPKPARTPGTIRRRRLVLSCQVCKRRKVKCDRQSPVCQRCIDGGCTDRCTYDERADLYDESTAESRQVSEVWTNPFPDPSASQQGQHPRLDALSGFRPNTQTHIGPQREHEGQLRAHAATIASHSSFLPVTPASSTRTAGSSEDCGPAQSLPRRVTVQGTGFKTQFHGSSHSVSIITYFEGLHGFLKQAASDHPLLGAHRWAVQSLPKSQSPVTPPEENPVNLLERSLPKENVCRSLMLAYFKHFEGIYRIIHVPVFWRRYDAFWAGKNGRDTAFLALLLAAMSCARCLQPDSPLSFDGDSSTARREAIRWAKAVEAWHDAQSHKHTTVEVFQVKCLLLLTKKVNAIKLKRHYTLSQTLLASAISIGLHRSPNSLGNQASVYEREMRRRIWATITELELDESIERGVPSLVSNLHTDVEAPGNLRDDDFDESTTLEPPNLPADTFTASSSLQFSHKIRPLQHVINNLVNHPEKHRNLSSSELSSHHENLFDAILELNSWPNSPTDLGFSDGAFLGSASLRLQLHRLLIMLHLPFAMRKPPSATAAHSRLVCLGSSREIVEIYAILSDRGFSQMCFTRMDLMRASLCLCLMESQRPPRDAIYNTNFSQSETNPAPITLIEKSLSLIELRILALGDGFRGLWLVFAASCFLSPRDQSAEVVPSSWQETVVNRVIVLCSKICLCQVQKGINGAENSDQLFARYMKHIQHTPVFAKVGDHSTTNASTEASSERVVTTNEQAMVAPSAIESGGLAEHMPDLGGCMNPLMEGLPANDWLNASMDDFGFSSWMDS